MFEKEAEEYLKKDGTKAESILNMLNEISPLKITLKQVPFVLAMIQQVFKDGAEFGYNKAFVEADKNLKAIVTDFNKANEWHNLNKNYKDLPNEGEWVEGLYIWYYKGEPHWDVFKVRWYYEIGELDEKLVRWYSYDENNSYENKIDEPGYWRKITLPMRNEYDRNY